jgi:hypothetical protein
MDSLKGRALHTIKDWEHELYPLPSSSPSSTQLPNWTGQLRAPGLGLNYLFNGANSKLLSGFSSHFTREELMAIMQLGSGSRKWMKAQEELGLPQVEERTQELAGCVKYPIS